MSSAHDLTYALPVRSTPSLLLSRFLSFFECPFIFELINGGHVIQDAAHLVIEHHSHEDGKEESHEKACSGKDHLGSVNEHEAVLIVAEVGLHRDQVEGVG